MKIWSGRNPMSKVKTGSQFSNFDPEMIFLGFRGKKANGNLRWGVNEDSNPSTGHCDDHHSPHLDLGKFILMLLTSALWSAHETCI